MPDRSYLLRGLNDSAVAGYFKLMVESAVILGADRERAEKDMLEALAFETILANVRVHTCTSHQCEIRRVLITMFVGSTHCHARNAATSVCSTTR